MEDHIWINAEIEVGKSLIGYCRMLKIIIVMNALAAVISLPSYTYRRNVAETIRGGHSQYTKILTT